MRSSIVSSFVIETGYAKLYCVDEHGKACEYVIRTHGDRGVKILIGGMIGPQFIDRIRIVPTHHIFDATWNRFPGNKMPIKLSPKQKREQFAKLKMTLERWNFAVLMNCGRSCPDQGGVGTKGVFFIPIRRMSKQTGQMVIKPALIVFDMPGRLCPISGRSQSWEAPYVKLVTIFPSDKALEKPKVVTNYFLNHWNFEPTSFHGFGMKFHTIRAMGGSEARKESHHFWSAAFTEWFRLTKLEVSRENDMLLVHTHHRPEEK